MTDLTPSIPFEAQADSASARMCGAAALCMVYRSIGMSCTQVEIWNSIQRMESAETACARTYLLALDALSRGVAALVVQAREPWAILWRCFEHGCRVILNHRLTLDAADGHYSVLAGIEDSAVLLHDPSLGPWQRRSRAELLQLWQARWGRSEIAGQVLVAFAVSDTAEARCPECGVALPASVQCVNCRAWIALRPSAALGCARTACPGRLWKRFFCPWCDAGHASLLENEPILEAPSAGEHAMTAVPQVQKLGAQIKRIASALEQLPAAELQAALMVDLTAAAAALDRIEQALQTAKAKPADRPPAAAKGAGGSKLGGAKPLDPVKQHLDLDRDRVQGLVDGLLEGQSNGPAHKKVHVADHDIWEQWDDWDSKG